MWRAASPSKAERQLLDRLSPNYQCRVRAELRVVLGRNEGERHLLAEDEVRITNALHSKAGEDSPHGDDRRDGPVVPNDSGVQIPIGDAEPKAVFLDRDHSACRLDQSTVVRDWRISRYRRAARTRIGGASCRRTWAAADPKERDED